MTQLNNTSRISQIRREREKRFSGNPLNYFSAASLTAAIANFNAGYLRDAARLWDAIERRDDILSSVAPKRRKAVSRLDWDIVPIAAAAPETARAHAAVLERFYNDITVSSAVDANLRGGVRLLVEQMLDCLGKQYSVHEIVWRPDPVRGLSAEFFFAPLWMFENTTGRLRYLEAEFATQGVELDPTGWLVCAAPRALMEASSIAYYLKREALFDWATFSQRFGAGFPLLKTTAAKGTEERAAAEDALANIAQNIGLVIGAQDAFEYVQPAGNGAPFESFIARMDRALAAIWRGSDLGTLSSQDGAGASLQGEESAILEDDDAVLVEEALEMCVSRRVIEYAFGSGVRPAAYFRLRRTDRADKKAAVELMAQAAAVGCPVSKKDFYEMSGLPAPEADEAVIAPQAAMPAFPAANEAPDASNIEALLAAHAKDGAKIRAAAERLAKAPDAEAYATALAELSEAMPELLESEAYAAAFADALVAKLEHSK